MKITPELQADRPTYSDTEQGYEIQVRRDAGCRVSCAGFPPLQGTHMSVCRIGGLMNTSFHSYSEWELFLLNNCAGRMNVPGHIPFKT